MSTLKVNNMKVYSGSDLAIGEAATEIKTVGNTTLGDSSSNTVTYNAKVDSAVIPDTDGTRNLGSSTARWNIYSATSTLASVTTPVSTDLTLGSTQDIILSPGSGFGVGLGTSDPASGMLLHLSKADCRARIEATTADNNCQLDFYNANGKYANIGNSINVAGSLFEINEVSPAASSRMTILTGGNVGIGTTTPTALLHVNGATTIEGDLTVNGTTTTVNSTTLTVDDKNIELNTSPSGTAGTDSTADGGGLTLKGDTDKTILWENDTDAWHYNQGINITSGKLGIGMSTAPTSQLEIEGSSGDLVIEIDNNAANSSNFKINNGAGNARTDFVLDNNTHVTLKGQRVGILDTSPSYTMDINGTLRSVAEAYFNTDATIGDDLSMLSDAAVINFGADSDIKLTHTADTNLVLSGVGSSTGLVINNTDTGDSFLAFAVDASSPPTQVFTMGVDDADADKFKIGTTSIASNTRLTIDSTGKVGIGADTPTSLLELESASGDLTFEMDNNVSNSSNFKIKCGAADDRVEMSVDDQMHITLKGQRVGILDTSPSYTLDVNGTGQITSNLIVGDDLFLQSDAAVLSFGAGDDVTLTHTNDVGLHLNAGMRLGFRDQGGEYIYSVSDGTLGIVAATEIDLTATTIDINGACDISGAFTLNGTTLAETIADTVGAMVGSNTETGIAVTYEDGDNTLDFVLAAAQTTITSLLATDIKIGEDDQTKIDFETADEIHFYAANVHQVKLTDNMFGPQADSDVDLGTTGVRWKAGYFDDVHTGDLHLSNDRGDWTVIEEEDYLSLRNNKNGKLFKIVMQEILEE